MTTAKPKLNRADLMFTKQTGQHDLMKKPGMVDGRQFKLADLNDCTVYLLDHTSQITVDRCENTTFFIGPVKGSIFFRDCKNCKISVACNQFRCRDLYDSSVYMYTTSDPVIESSDNIKIAPYNLAYPKLGEHVKECGFDVNDNRWDLVFDFTPGQSTNFQIMDPSEWAIEHKAVPDMEEAPEVAFPYPVRYGGIIPDDANVGKNDGDENMHEFSIAVTKDEAMRAVQQEQNQQDQFAGNDAFGGDMQMNFQNDEQVEALPVSFVDNSDPFGMVSQQPMTQPAFMPQAANDGEDYSPEELAIMAEVEQVQQDRQRALYDNQVEESRLKQEKKANAQAALAQWKQDLAGVAAQRKSQNEAETSAREEFERSEKFKTNPWERVYKNIPDERSERTKRMYEAIVNRKSDMTKGGIAIKKAM